MTVMEPVSPMGRVKRVAIVSSAGLCYRDVDYRVGLVIVGVDGMGRFRNRKLNLYYIPCRLFWISTWKSGDKEIYEQR